MSKRQNQVSVIQLQKQFSNKQRKRQIIDVTAPTLRLQKILGLHENSHKSQKNLASAHSQAKRKRFPVITCKSLSRKSADAQHLQKSSCCDELKTPQTLDMSIPQEKYRDRFMLKKNDGKQLMKLVEEQRFQQLQKIIRYRAHPDDKMHERIQTVQIDFKSMTVEESIGIRRDIGGTNRSASVDSNDDPFRKYLPQKKYYKVFPTIFRNTDHKRGLFAIQVNRPDSKLNVEQQHRQHEAALSKAQKLDQQSQSQANHIIYIPKPTTRYCFVCRGHFDQYLQHINTKLHQSNDSNSKIWNSIKDICKKVQLMECEEKINKFKLLKSFSKIEKQENGSQANNEHNQKKKRRKNQNKQKQPENLTKHKSNEKKNIVSKYKYRQKVKQENQQQIENIAKIFFKSKQSVHKGQTRQITSKKTLIKQCEMETTKQVKQPTQQQLVREHIFDCQQVIVTQDPKQGKNKQIKYWKDQISVKQNRTIIVHQDKIKQRQRQRRIFKTVLRIKPKDSSEQVKITQQKNQKPIVQGPMINQRQVIKDTFENMIIEKFIPLNKQPEKLVSILHTQYPKLVPEGQTYKKPSKPATVSLCLKDKEQQDKYHLKQSKQKQNKQKLKIKDHMRKNLQNQRKKQLKSDDLNFYKQRTIEECFHVKAQQAKEQIGQQKIHTKKKGDKNRESHKDKQFYKDKKQKYYSESNEENYRPNQKSFHGKYMSQRQKNSSEETQNMRQNQNKPTFLGLAKTRSKQKVVNNTSKQKLSIIHPNQKL